MIASEVVVEGGHPFKVVIVRWSSVIMVSAVTVVTPPSTVIVAVPEVSLGRMTVVMSNTVTAMVMAGVGLVPLYV